MSYRVNSMEDIQLHVVNIDTMEHECRNVLCLPETREETGCVWLSSNGRMVDDGLSWMRNDTGLHHYSWEIAECPDYHHLGDRLDTIETNFIWGSGRHPPSKNLYNLNINKGRNS